LGWSRNSSGTITDSPQYLHKMVLFSPWVSIGAPQEGQLKVLAIMIPHLQGIDNAFINPGSYRVNPYHFIILDRLTRQFG
jgi:alpha-beta hydrolase superfamily lysophospholipase